ncbi:MAG: NAD(P)-binding domain-containing protein, partial [Blastocatellia bacterium]|nr:NAD(P)-binding domain-containing protein [Blastocatellia bacterium]
MSTEHITIIGGTGDQGKGLALRWAKAGFQITIGSRSGDRAAAAAAEMRALLANFGEQEYSIDGLRNSEAAASSSIIVLTVPFAAQISTMKEISPVIGAGSLLIDVTVPLEATIGGKAVRTLGVWAGSAAEQCAELTPA